MTDEILKKIDEKLRIIADQRTEMNIPLKESDPELYKYLMDKLERERKKFVDDLVETEKFKRKFNF